MVITDEMWTQARLHLLKIFERETLLLYYGKISKDAMAKIETLKNSYDDGERSEDLYEAIMQLK